MEDKEQMQLREAWLERAVAILHDYLRMQGLPLDSLPRVSCGWPSRGGLGLTLGECVPPHLCEDDRPQIFISPRIVDSVEVLGILLHELIHITVGCEHGHGKKFSQAASKVGLIRPWRATTVGERLRPVLERFVAVCGPYPHAAIQIQLKEPKGSRLRLYECNCQPPMKVRVASDTLHAQCLLCGNPFRLAFPGNGSVVNEQKLPKVSRCLICFIFSVYTPHAAYMLSLVYLSKSILLEYIVIAV